MADPNKNDDFSALARDIIRELKATSDLVVDAARLGKDELLHYVRESMHGGWAGSTQPHTQQNARQPESGAARPAANAAGAAVPTSVRSSKPQVRKVSYGRWALFCCGLPFMTAALICFLTMLGTLYYGNDPLGFVLMLTALGLSVPGGILLGLFRKKTRRERLYARYLRAVGAQPYMSIERIARVMRRRESRVIEDLEDMVSRGYFGPEAKVHMEQQLLIVDVDAALEAEARKAAIRQEDEKAAIQREKAAMRKEAAVQSEDDVYEKMLLQLRTLNERIEDEPMSQRIYRIEAVARATFLAVQAKPEKKSQIRRFMDYYLPTTIKLLDAYAGFEKQDVSGENIRKSRENIEKMTETLSVAFEKQFDALFLTETMDINAEIRTMDSLLRQDGFVGGMEMPR